MRQTLIPLRALYTQLNWAILPCDVIPDGKLSKLRSFHMLHNWQILLLCGPPPKDCGMYCMKVISLFHHAESSPFCNWYYLFALLLLSKQTRHERNTVTTYLFLFICGRATCLSCEQCVVTALRSSCRLQKYLERWPTASKDAGWSV
jgi:hypothetical protein